MKNRLADLNNHLFAQMERLSEEGIGADQLEQEVSRTNAIVKVADKIIGNGTLQLRAVALNAEYGGECVMPAGILDGPQKPQDTPAGLLEGKTK